MTLTIDDEIRDEINKKKSKLCKGVRSREICEQIVLHIIDNT